jgi:hypothetical protein
MQNNVHRPLPASPNQQKTALIQVITERQEHAQGLHFSGPGTDRLQGRFLKKIFSKRMLIKV